MQVKFKDHIQMLKAQVPSLFSSSGELPKPSLTKEQILEFNQKGYLVLPNLISARELEEIRQRIKNLLEQAIPIPPGIKFEEEPNLNLSSKSGHSMSASGIYRQIWDIVPQDPVITSLVAKNPKIVSCITSLLGNDLKLFRATVMLKQAYVGSEKPYHQDSAYWPIFPYNLVSCWLALDDTDKKNGCLKLIPGAHKLGSLPFVQGEIHRTLDIDTLDMNKEIYLEVKKGDAVLFHSLLPHASEENRTNRNRFAVICSYMASQSKYIGKTPKPKFFPICGRSYWRCV